MYKDNRNERVNMLNELLVNGASADSLPVLTQETLLIWGNQDNVFPTYLAHQLNSSGQTVYRLIILFHATSHLGKKSRLEIVKDAGHVCQFENPDSVNYLIENFLLESN
ncbi:hypothetical protein ZOSMA_240G00200 [Zostera marina]|uniref:AB hydrolase-1 domain-containing protein n=1 Tax=Zostera marina TaxID=29655 RepID=A0A0K9PJC9_ZOSMR|nr:hypothetical protein ZOSMA_240G00200 [Zostera marina]